MKTVFNIPGDTLNGFVGLPVEILDITGKMIQTPRVRCSILDGGHVLRGKSPYPVQKSETTFHSLLAPLQVAFRRSSKKTEEPGCVRTIFVQQNIRIDDIFF